MSPCSVALRGALGLLIAAWFLLPAARADGVGFQLERYEPTPAGEWFLAVPHPWYSSTRWFGAALTLDYAHNPLVAGTHGPSDSFVPTGPAIRHQLLGHVDVAGSVFDRVTLSLTLPMVLFESGAASLDFKPVTGVVVGDLRLAATVRLWGQPDESPFSIHLGGALWFPVHGATEHAGDLGVRGLARLVLAGMWASHVRFSLDGGVLFRPAAVISAQAADPGNSAGHELRLGAALAWTDTARRWALGPELLVATAITGGHAFKADYSSVELLGSLHVQFARSVIASAGAGFGSLRLPGTPDARLIARIAWAPGRADRDGDGIGDFEDACPDRMGPRSNDPGENGCPPDSDGDGVRDDEDRCPAVPAGAHPDPARPGCPLPDRDGDGIADAEDQCPDVAAGDHPDPKRRGCPFLDRDHDLVPDAADECPDEPAGETPDPKRTGCPFADRDSDGVADADDQCPDTPAGPHPDPKKPGCPDGDRDGDGVYDAEDQCPDTPFGYTGDPAHPGCPAPDRDGDKVPDALDACPDAPGAPSDDPKKNGCPGRVIWKSGRLLILQPVFFATDQDTILPKSFPILAEVTTALRLAPGVKKIEIGGHTDNRGRPAQNLALSQRRAESVMKWLVAHGIAAERMSARGFGATQPLVPNLNNRNRGINRRVEFKVTDPAPPPKVTRPAKSTRPGRTKRNDGKPNVMQFDLP